MFQQSGSLADETVDVGQRYPTDYYSILSISTSTLMTECFKPPQTSLGLGFYMAVEGRLYRSPC